MLGVRCGCLAVGPLECLIISFFFQFDLRFLGRLHTTGLISYAGVDALCSHWCVVSSV